MDYTYDDEDARRRQESIDSLAASLPMPGEEPDGRLSMSARDFPALNAPKPDAVDALAQSAVDAVKDLPATAHERGLEGLAPSTKGDDILTLGKHPYDPELGDTTENQPAPIDNAISGLTGSAPKLAAPPAAVTKVTAVVEKPGDEVNVDAPKNGESNESKVAEQQKSDTAPKHTAADSVKALRDRMAAGEFNKSTAAEEELAGRKPGISPWAVAASVLLNKGRDLGQVVGMAEQQKQQWLHDRLALAKAKGGDALEREMKLVGYELSAERVGTAQGGQALSAERLAEMMKEHRDRDDPDSARRRTEIAVREALAAAGVTGKKNAEHGLVTQTAEDATTVHKAGRKGELDAEHDNNPVAAEDKKVVAAATALGTKQGEHAAEATGTDGKLLTIPGLETVDEGQARRVLGDPASRRKLEDSMAVLLGAERGMARMEQIRKEAGIQPFNSEAKSEFNRLRSEVVAAESKLDDQGVVSPTEFKLHVKDIPGLEFSDDFVGNTGRALSGFFGGEQVDPVLDALKGTHKALIDSINNGLKVRGFRMVDPNAPKATADVPLGSPPPAAAAPPAAPAPAALRPVPTSVNLSDAPKEDDLDSIMGAYGARRRGQ